MKPNKLTIFLFVVVLGTLGLTFARRQNASGPRQDRILSKQQDDALKQHQAKKEQFPVASYEEPELSDVRKNLALRQKKLRKNDFKIVTKNPAPWQAEVVVLGGVEAPTIPVAESSCIVLGQVTAAEAHVSENKKNVYSEFTVVVDKVFKTDKESISEGKEISVDRIGGFVKYPNGQTLLYRFSGENMPSVGGRYIFFLKVSSSQDLSIVTGYHLGVNGISPLDDAPQFEKMRGLTEESFIQRLRESLEKSSPN